MTLPLSTTRAQLALAVLLALQAGYLDGYGLLFLGTYVSFMSGNTTTTGLKSAQGNAGAAIPSAIAIAGFLAGSFLGNLAVQSRLRHSHRLIFAAIAVLLAAVSSVDSLQPEMQIAMLGLAMGLLNPALSKIGSEAASLTFVTGTLARLGSHLAAAAGRKPLADAQGPGDTHLARARIDASLWAGFLTGAALAGRLASHAGGWALAPPCSVMIVLALLDTAPSRKTITSPVPGAQRAG